jgi:hypothetical protein
MYEAPLWEVAQVRESKDLAALKALLDKYYTMLKPYKKQ